MGKVTRSGQNLPSPAKRTTPIKNYKGRLKKKQVVTHVQLNPRKLSTKGEVLSFLHSRTSRSALPRLNRSDAVSQLLQSLIGSVQNPGSWLKSQCSPGGKKYFYSQLAKLEKEHQKIKIKNKQNVLWRKESVKLFDLFTEPKEGEFFDRDFYENQKNGARDQEISNDLTKEYVELVEESAEAEGKRAAKVLRESGTISHRVSVVVQDSDEPSDNSDSETCDPNFTVVDPQDASEVSRNLDFSAPRNSGSRKRRSNSVIDPCIAGPSLVDQNSNIQTRNSKVNKDKCDQCDQLLPQFRKCVETQTPGVNSWENDKDLSSKDFNPWPQLSLRYPKARQRNKEAKTFVPEVIEAIVDIHTGNRVGIKSAIDIFRKVSKLFGQVLNLPKEVRVVKGLQLDPLKKRKKKASYSTAGKQFKNKKFRPTIILSNTESEGENDDHK